MTQKFKVFIDGEAGTTGLQIRQRLQHHDQIELISIDHELRKDSNEKQRLMQLADVTIFCLPDAAAKEAATLAEAVNARVIDASSAHRIVDGWTYGLPELNNTQRAKIATAQKVSNPGCYATGATLLLKPISHMLAEDTQIAINAVSGYTGGGNQMIDQYQQAAAPSAYALYGLNFEHKHIPEIQTWSELNHKPSFFPSVVNLPQGMLIQIPLAAKDIDASAATIAKQFADYYQGQTFIRVMSAQDILDNKFCFVEGNEGSNYCDVGVISAEDGQRHLLVARLDNLGKGASGAAVQNLNIMLGLDESKCVSLTS